MIRAYTLHSISCIVLVFACCITASAIELSIPSLTANAGSSITVPINVDDAKGIAGGDITLTFDETILTAKEAKATELTKSLNFVPNIMADKVILTMASAKGIAEGSGAMVEIVFEVSATAKDGTKSPLTFTDAALYDELGNDIPVTVVNGNVTISSVTNGNECSATFVVTGTIYEEDGKTPLSNGVEVTVKNLTKGTIQTTQTGSIGTGGGYSVTFIDMQKNAAACVGDEIEVIVSLEVGTMTKYLRNSQLLCPNFPKILLLMQR